MGHGMGAYFHSDITQFAQLFPRKIAARVQKTHGCVAGSAEAKFMEKRGDKEEIGLAAVVQGQDNTFATIACERLTHAHAAVASIFKRMHLLTKLFVPDHISDVSCVVVAHGPSGKLDLVIHEVDTTRDNTHKFTGPSPSPRMMYARFRFVSKGPSFSASGLEAAKMKFEGPRRYPAERNASPHA